LLKRFLNSDNYEAGCDEAGRGCLAGPVCAAAVIMPPDYGNPLLNDSKQMSVRNREVLRKEIEQVAISFGVAFIDNCRIDELNILRASIMAMHRALDILQCRPNHILVDGNKFYPYRDTSHTCVIKGDGKYISIAAASVLAKTYRDEYMLTLHSEYKNYGWDKNKGYPTQFHRDAIVQFGISKYHRRSFQLTNTQTEIIFV
jgi:ribonuclease HII